MCENRENSPPPATCFKNTNKSFLLKRNTPRFPIVVSGVGAAEVGSGTKPTTRCAAGRGRPALLAGAGSAPCPQGYPAVSRRGTVSASARFSRYGYAYAQNDKLLGRARRLIRISIIKTKRTPVPPCHCERSVAISRKGNVGNAPAPAHLPAAARRREIPRGRNGTKHTCAS